MALYQFTPRRDNLKIWLPILIAVSIFPLFVRDEYLLNTAVMAGIYIILTSSLNITNGYTGLFSFGHAAFYGIGAYTAAILSTRFGFPFLLTLPLAGLVAACFGAAIAIPTLRLKGIFLALVTIGFQQITYLVIMNWMGLTRGPMGIPAIPSGFLFRVRAVRKPRLLLPDPGPQPACALFALPDHRFPGRPHVCGDPRG